jgi:mRNA interferase MazF
MSRYTPKRGDIVWLSFTPQVGHEHSGRRPALVLSPESYNRKVGLFIACPITSHKKGYPFEVDLGDSLSIKGVILADQVKSLDWRERRAEYADHVGSSTLNDVIAKLDVLINA